MGDQSSRIRSRLREAIQRREQGAVAGLNAWALLVERRAKEKVPVHFGNLRASGYTLRSKPFQFEVGFSARYAVYVHENLEMKWEGDPRRDGIGVYWGPQGEAQFLRKALDGSRKEGLELVREYMNK